MRNSALIVVVSSLMLGSCTTYGSVQPEEVLNRSSVANSGLVSAHINLDVRLTSADVSAGSTDGTLNVQGNIQQGGKQLDMLFDSAGTKTAVTQPFTWKAAGHLIVLSDQESYLNVNSLDTTPPLPALSSSAFTGFINTWFRLPASGASQATLTPDPRFLRLQSEAVRVTKDHGLDSSNGMQNYHYDVIVDPNRLHAYFESMSGSGSAEAMKQMETTLSAYTATGEIWIDAKTFLLTKAVWNVKKKNDPTFSILLSMSLSDPGKPVTISAPSDAKPFPTAPLLPINNATVLQEF